MPTSEMVRQQHKVEVEQLRRELAVDRKNVSQVCKELIGYCETHKKNDVLFTGFSANIENPYREQKSGCTIV